MHRRSKTAGMDQQGGFNFTHSCHWGCVSAALENRDDAIVNVPGAFMTWMSWFRYVSPGPRLICYCNLTLACMDRMSRMKKGEKVIFVELLKVLYGMLRAAILFWRKLSAKLGKKGILQTHMIHAQSTIYHRLACGWPENITCGQ